MNNTVKDPSVYSGKMYSEIRSRHSYKRSAVKSVVAARKSMKTPTLPGKEDLESVFTRDNLRKFNDAMDIQDEYEQRSHEDQQSYEDPMLEEGDHVAELIDEQPDGLSQAPSAKKSGISSVSKIYISKLEQQLESEKQARLRLEREVEEMKKINAEISEKLGLSTQPSQM